MSSLSRKYQPARPDSVEVMPPNVVKFGVVPFGEPQRVRLAEWLREAGWPRKHMDVATLEGYLVALMVWPVGISSGAWLPRIWGETGWKVPTKIATRSQFDEFVALIIGFMREIDHELSRQPSRFESSVLRSPRDHGQQGALHRWGHGFMTALTLGAQGLKWRSTSAGESVRTIASATAWPAPFRPTAVEDVLSAVLALMKLRTSRGPLGPLEVMIPLHARIEGTTPS